MKKKKKDLVLTVKLLGIKRKIARKDPLRPTTVTSAIPSQAPVNTKPPLSTLFPEISPLSSSDKINNVNEESVNDLKLKSLGPQPVKPVSPDLPSDPQKTENSVIKKIESDDKKRTANEFSADNPPQTPRKNRKYKPRTPQSARVVSADNYFPKFIRRTPTHRSPRALNPYFSAPVNGNTTPGTPTIYSMAKALFQRGSYSTQVVGRNQERYAIEQFLNKRLETRGKGALYLSGLPGTGKSALLSEVVEKRVKHYKSTGLVVKVANINCMTVENASDIFMKIHEEISQGEDLEAENELLDQQEENQEDLEEEEMISGDGKRLTTDRAKRLIIEDLERRILRQPANSTTRHVIVLDELDHIMTKDQEVLFRIFQWAFASNSTLVLFGIANALDLTDRFLPRLRSNSLTPQLLAFKPYTADQIAKIIEERLWSLVGGVKEDNGTIPLMHPAAIQLCARKTASNTGDLRKSFDLCRRAIETVEEEVRKKHTGDAADPGQGWKKALIAGGLGNTSALTLDDAPRVTITHMAKVCSIAFGGTMAARVRSLNLQQKAVLCVLVVGEKHGAKLMISNLFDKYIQACGRDKVLAPLTYPDFLDVIAALEANGVVNITGICGRKGLRAKDDSRVRTSKGGTGAAIVRNLSGREDYSKRRIASNVHQMDLISTVGSTPLLKSFLIDM